MVKEELEREIGLQESYTPSEPSHSSVLDDVKLPQPREPHKLRRGIGWFGAFSMGYADVGADIYIALGLVVAYGAGASPFAFMIGSIAYICTGLAYAELATAYPYAGGAQIYAMKATNDGVGFLAGWAVMLDYTICIALFSVASAGYLTFFFPWIKTVALVANLGFTVLYFPAVNLIAFSIVLVLIVLNLFGIKESSAMNSGLTGVSLGVQSLILLLGIALGFSLPLFLNQILIVGSSQQFYFIQYVPALSVSNQNFIYGLTIAMASFIGIESIAQAAEETKNPSRWIPRANKLSIISVMVFALGLSTVAMGMVPWESLAAAKGDPMAFLASSIPIIGSYLAPIVAFTGFAICLVSTNTGVIGVSRIVYSMGKYDLLPSWFYKTDEKHHTPYRTIIIFGMLGALLAVLAHLELIAELYNFGALLSYIIVNICLLILRKKDHKTHRPWKVPTNIKIKKPKEETEYDIPIIGLIGTAMCTLLWILVIIFHPQGRILGALWMVVGVVGYVTYRKGKGLNPVSKETGKRIHPAGYVLNTVVLVRLPEDEEFLYESIRTHLDTRFKLLLLNIIDPKDYGMDLARSGDRTQLLALKQRSEEEIHQLAKKLHKKGYAVDYSVDLGKHSEIMAEYQNELNEVFVLIQRRRRKPIKADVAIATDLRKYGGCVIRIIR